MSDFQTLPLTVPDLVCELDADPFANETKSDLQSLEQDVFHRLLELPGSNIDDPTLGIGVEELLSGSTAQLPHVARRIEQQLALDDRIDAVRASLTQLPDGTINLEIIIQVGQKITGLQYAYSQAQGLQVVNTQ